MSAARSLTSCICREISCPCRGSPTWPPLRAALGHWAIMYFPAGHGVLRSNWRTHRREGAKRQRLPIFVSLRLCGATFLPSPLGMGPSNVPVSRAVAISCGGAPGATAWVAPKRRCEISAGHGVHRSFSGSACHHHLLLTPKRCSVDFRKRTKEDPSLAQVSAGHGVHRLFCVALRACSHAPAGIHHSRPRGVLTYSGQR